MRSGGEIAKKAQICVCEVDGIASVYATAVPRGFLSSGLYRAYKQTEPLSLKI